MTSFFNFRTECLYKYNQEVYEMFMDSFDLIPLSCIINGKFIGIHGGLSPNMDKVHLFYNQLIKRYQISTKSTDSRSLQGKASSATFCGQTPLTTTTVPATSSTEITKSGDALTFTGRNASVFLIF